MAKDSFLVVRMEKKDLERLKKAARKDHLAPATWSRQALLQALERAEKAESGS